MPNHFLEFSRVSLWSLLSSGFQFAVELEAVLTDPLCETSFLPL